MDHARLRVVLLAAFAAVPLCLTQHFGFAADDDKHITTVAVIDFDYVDTSGEVRDQQGEHTARLMNFMNALKGGLAKRNNIRIIAPTCLPEPCSAAHSSEGNLLNAARAAGADLLLVGGIHKMSTLVQWAKVEAIDIRSGQIVFDKLFTFRGDTDLAWRHAEEYMEATILDEVAKSTSSR